MVRTFDSDDRFWQKYGQVPLVSLITYFQRLFSSIIIEFQAVSIKSELEFPLIIAVAGFSVVLTER